MERVKGLLSWDEQKAIQKELTDKYEAEAMEERKRAYAAVSAALDTYRWWGWTNIVNTVRLWIQGMRWR